MIDLRVFGALDLRRREGQELRSVLAQPKRTALLVYLALARPRGFHRRDQLVALFWPEHDSEHARNSLRQSIHFLRRSLGEQAIASRGDEEIAVDDGVLSTDAVRFDAALDAGDPERALGLYAGDLLPGFFVEEAPAFERWLEAERTRLRECAVRACWSLAEAREAAGDTAGAAEWGRRALDIAPTDDSQILRLMRLLARAGDRSGALAAFEAHARRLRTELEVEPTALARTLAEEIRKAAPDWPKRAEAPARRVTAGEEDVAAEADRGSPERHAAAWPTEAQPTPPNVTSPGSQAGLAESRSDEIPVRRYRRAPGPWLSGVAGILIGIPVALLAVGLGHALWPDAVPLVGAAVLLGAAGLVLAEVALLGLWVVRRRDADMAAGPLGRAGAGLGFALGVGVALSFASTLAPSPPRAPTTRYPRLIDWVDTVPRKVAVTRFANLTGDPALDPVGRLAEDWVARRLRSIPEAQVVATAPATAADTSLDAVTALAQRTGADLVLFGSYYREGEDLLLTASLVPPRGGRIPSEITGMAIGPVRAPRDRPVGAIERLASMVAGGVAAECAFPLCAPGRRAPVYEARQLYAEGFQAVGRGDRGTARRKFRQAIAQDSTFANAYTHLAEVLGTCSQKDSIGDMLEARRQDFSRVDLLYMRGIRATCHGDVEAAYRFRREEYDLAARASGAGLAGAALNSGRLREAEARYRAFVEDTMRPGPSWFEYASLTYALHLEGKFTEELRVADEGRRRVPEDPRIASLGLRGLAAFGRTREVEARVDEARRAGANLLDVAGMYVDAARELEWHGRSAPAKQLALAALQELDRASAAERADGRYVQMQASMLLELGRWGEARRLADGGDPRDPFLVTERGLAAAGRGDTAAAHAALTALDRLPDSVFEEHATLVGRLGREYCQASVLATLGIKDEALRRLEDGQARNRLPHSGPQITHADSFLLHSLWHDPRFERMFAARD